MSVQPLRSGDAGDAVLDIQARLTALGYPTAPDDRGHFGHATQEAVRAFQIRRGLDPSGEIATDTWRELVEAGYRLGSRLLWLRRPLMRGDDVRDLQTRLSALGFDAGTQDGLYGRQTEHAVRDFQRNQGLEPDGQVGRATIDALHRLRMRIGPGSKAELRQQLDREHGGVEGRLVFLDPGHGGPDAGVLTGSGIPESYIVFRVAEVAADLLDDMGARAVLSRPVQLGPAEDRRAQEANDASADVAVSFHLACRPDPGPSVAYYRGQWTHSRMGQQLAQDVAGALQPSVGRSASVIGRNLPFLQATVMPAILVDLATPGSDPLVGSDPYLAGLGIAVAQGVRSYFD